MSPGLISYTVFANDTFGNLQNATSNFTVVEGFFLPNIFNTFEHLFNLIAAVIFLIGALKIKVA